MNERIRKNTVASCWIIFAILIFVHGFEAIVLRMDETFLGENFINKVFGIVDCNMFLHSYKCNYGGKHIPRAFLSYFTY